MEETGNTFVTSSSSFLSFRCILATHFSYSVSSSCLDTDTDKGTDRDDDGPDIDDEKVLEIMS